MARINKLVWILGLPRVVVGLFAGPFAVFASAAELLALAFVGPLLLIFRGHLFGKPTLWVPSNWRRVTSEKVGLLLHGSEYIGQKEYLLSKEPDPHAPACNICQLAQLYPLSSW